MVGENNLLDVRWLGFDWGELLTHASDYFEQLYLFAEELIQKGKAYVESQNAEEIRELRGTLTEPGKNSPFRERSVGDNLTLFRKCAAVSLKMALMFYELKLTWLHRI